MHAENSPLPEPASPTPETRDTQLLTTYGRFMRGVKSAYHRGDWEAIGIALGAFNIAVDTLPSLDEPKVIQSAASPPSSPTPETAVMEIKARVEDWYYNEDRDGDDEGDVVWMAEDLATLLTHIEKLSASPPSSPTELTEVLKSVRATWWQYGIRKDVEGACAEIEAAVESLVEARTRERDEALQGWESACDDLRDTLLELISVRSENERLRGEIKAMGEMYKQVCDPLQECCQKYKLGLGGELCHELVIEEIDRLRQQVEDLNKADLRDQLAKAKALSLSPEEAAGVLDVVKNAHYDFYTFATSMGLSKLHRALSSKGQK